MLCSGLGSGLGIRSDVTMSLCVIRYDYDTIITKKLRLSIGFRFFSKWVITHLYAITQHRPMPTLYRVVVHNLARNSRLDVRHRPLGRLKRRQHHANGRSKAAAASAIVTGDHPASGPTHHPLFDLFCRRRYRTAVVRV